MYLFGYAIILNGTHVYAYTLDPIRTFVKFIGNILYKFLSSILRIELQRIYERKRESRKKSQ